MSFSSDFFKGFWEYITGLQVWQATIIITLIVVLLILSPLILTGCKILFNSFIKLYKKGRRCGDCILIIFGISEKYKLNIDTLRRKILENQMTYVEQKIEMLILELLRTYQEDQQIIAKEKAGYPSEEMLERDYINYKESIGNAIELAKKEIRRSFKENGFDGISGKEFATYVKEKAVDLLAIARRYMMNTYYKNAFVSLEYRFKTFDERQFEDIVFEVYIKAKEIRLNTEAKIKELEEKFKEEIDNLIKENK